MAKLAGKSGALYDGSTELLVTDVSMDENMNLAEVSDMGDAGEEQLATQSSATISFNLTWNPSNAGHTGLVTKLRAGTPISSTWIFSGTKGSGSAIGLTGTFVLDKFSRKTAKKDALTASASGKFTGVPADATNL